MTFFILDRFTAGKEYAHSNSLKDGQSEAGKDDIFNKWLQYSKQS